MWLARPIALFAAAPETQQNTRNYSPTSKYSRSVIRQRWGNCKGILFSGNLLIYTIVSQLFPIFSATFGIIVISSSSWRLESISLADYTTSWSDNNSIQTKRAAFFSPVGNPISCRTIYFGPNFFVKSFYCLFAITGYVDKLHFCNLATQMTK